MPAIDPDLPLRQAAVTQARRLAELYTSSSRSRSYDPALPSTASE